MGKDMETRHKKTSKWWYLLPIFFGIIGGAIGYFILKNRDRKFTEKLLIIGLVMTAVCFVLNFLFSGPAYLYFSDMFANVALSLRGVSIIEVVDSYCSGGTVTIVLRNIGTGTIPASKQACTQTSGMCLGKCLPVDLAPGSATSLTIVGCDPATTHTWSIKVQDKETFVPVFCQ